MSNDADPLAAALTAHLTWMRLRNLRPTTLVHRRRAILRLAAALSPVHVLSATPGDLQRWQEALRLTDRGRSNETSQVASFYRWARDQALIPTDPARDLIRPRLRRGRPRPIPESDLRFAVVHAPERIRPWLVLAGWAGLRACEIAGLERDDVCESDTPPMLVIRHGKGDRERLVPLTPYVDMTLREYGLPTRGPIFLRADGYPGPNTPGRISHLANRYLHSVGITATLHQLRHRFGTRVYQHTHDLRLVQEIMGHSDPATTAGYAGVHPRSYRLVLDVFSPETVTSSGSMLYTRQAEPQEVHP